MALIVTNGPLGLLGNAGAPTMDRPFPSREQSVRWPDIKDRLARLGHGMARAALPREWREAWRTDPLRAVAASGGRHGDE